MFIVDGRSTIDAAQDILDITACMLKIQKEVKIWDWRVLRWLVEPQKSGPPSAEALKACLVASMEPDCGTVGEELRGVTVDWHDGLMESVPRAKAQKLNTKFEKRMNKFGEKQKRSRTV